MDQKSFYPNSNNMFAGFYVSVWPKGKAYERAIYEILDCLGNIGGFQEGFGFLFVFANFLFCSGMLTVNQADLYYEINGEEEKDRGCCFNFLAILKYFLYFINFGDDFEQKYEEMCDAAEKLEELTGINQFLKVEVKDAPIEVEHSIMLQQPDPFEKEPQVVKKIDRRTKTMKYNSNTPMKKNGSQTPRPYHKSSSFI